MGDLVKRGRRRIVVVGGGAELVTALARRARRKGTELVLVDPAPAHVSKPRLYEVAVGLIRPGEVEISYLALGQASGFSFVLGALTGLDARTRTIPLGAVQAESSGELLPVREIAYDKLVLAFGSQVNDFGVPGRGPLASSPRRGHEGAPVMADGGAVVLVGSIADVMGSATCTTFAATKAALRSYARN